MVAANVYPPKTMPQQDNAPPEHTCNTPDCRDGVPDAPPLGLVSLRDKLMGDLERSDLEGSLIKDEGPHESIHTKASVINGELIPAEPTF